MALLCFGSGPRIHFPHRLEIARRKQKFASKVAREAYWRAQRYVEDANGLSAPPANSLAPSSLVREALKITFAIQTADIPALST